MHGGEEKKKSSWIEKLVPAESHDDGYDDDTGSLL